MPSNLCSSFHSLWCFVIHWIASFEILGSIWRPLTSVVVWQSINFALGSRNWNDLRSSSAWCPPLSAGGSGNTSVLLWGFFTWAISGNTAITFWGFFTWLIFHSGPIKAMAMLSPLYPILWSLSNSDCSVGSNSGQLKLGTWSSHLCSISRNSSYLLGVLLFDSMFPCINVTQIICKYTTYLHATTMCAASKLTN